MFKDAQEELKRLEQELLAEEYLEESQQQDEAAPEEDILDDEVLRALLEDTQTIADPEDYQNYSNDYGVKADDRTRVFRVYNTDRSDQPLEEYAEALQQPGKEKLTGLIVTAALLTAGIVGVLIWWILRFWVLR